MGISGVGARSHATVQSLVEMRRQLDELQRQLGSGKKANTYAGLGLDSGLTVSLRSRLSAISGYADAMTTIGVRIDLAQTTLTRLAEIGRQVKTILLNPAVIAAGGQTATQEAAKNGLDELLGLLNTRAGDRYLFSGRSVDKAAVETSDHIMNGDGARAGLKQLIAERNQADLGSNGLGPARSCLPSWEPPYRSARMRRAHRSASSLRASRQTLQAPPQAAQATRRPRCRLRWAP